MTAAISGTVEPRFEPVRAAFVAAFRDRPTMGAALHVRVGGRPVVDLWGGVADERDGRPWHRDTPSVVFSCTKGLVSILAARLVEDGRLAYDAPVAQYWPRFGAAGKAGTTVAELLAHRAGLPAPRLDLSFEDILDWDRMADLLADQAPLWCPGTAYAYHAITHGWLAGEVIRRVTGRTVGGYFERAIARPLGADAWIGLPEAMRGRPAHLQVADSLAALWRNEQMKPGPNWPCRAMTLGGALPAALVTPDGGFNDPRLQAAEVPGAGGIATATALAAIWSATVTPTDGVRLIGPGAIDIATRTQSEGPPFFAAEPPYARWGMGFQLDSEARRYLSAASFGHDGAGGQVGFADPDAELGFGFVTNWMMGPEDTRATRIIDALRDALS
ncbi:MAG: beta-lactamase family protein [Devosia sp.]|nr:beta-lactamase family protein [Devosia sp.]